MSRDNSEIKRKKEAIIDDIQNYNFMFNMNIDSSVNLANENDTFTTAFEDVIVQIDQIRKSLVALIPTISSLTSYIDIERITERVNHYVNEAGNLCRTALIYAQEGVVKGSGLKRKHKRKRKGGAVSSNNLPVWRQSMPDAIDLDLINQVADENEEKAGRIYDMNEVQRLAGMYINRLRDLKYINDGYKQWLFGIVIQFLDETHSIITLERLNVLLTGEEHRQSLVDREYKKLSVLQQTPYVVELSNRIHDWIHNELPNENWYRLEEEVQALMEQHEIQQEQTRKRNGKSKLRSCRNKIR